MNWKYKHFHQQRTFPAPREDVFAAARAVMGESLGWTLTDSADGFRAEGSSFGHDAIADFHIQSAADGTKVDVELMVERAGATGFMLFDVGGYYNIQLRKWLESIQTSIHQKLTGQEAPGPPSLTPPNKAAARVFHGCLLLIAASFGLYFLVTFIAAVVGVTTGNLYLVGRNGSTTLHGVSARVMSLLILLFGAWVLWRIRRMGRSGARG